MNTTLSPLFVQRFQALQSELMLEAAAVPDGLSPKLKQVIRVLEWSRIESLVHCYDSGPGQQPADQCALAGAFIAKVPTST